LQTLRAIQAQARETILYEAQSVKNLADFIDEDFAQSVQLIYNSTGRVIITGVGKSAIIAQKIVATLNSTGTPAVFMHAADAIHGDLGIIQDDDIALCLSRSGDTPEIKVLVPLIKRFGNRLIAMVSQTNSYLAKQADFVLKATIEREACPNNLAPTTSTTAQIVIGDALAVSLLRMRSFTSEDYAKYHPGGSLGKKLYLKVKDLYVNNFKPKVYLDDMLEKVIVEISSKLLGATAVIDQYEQLKGIITDGDLRRMLQHNEDFKNLMAKDIMSASPKTISPDALAIEAFNRMEDNNITQLLVAEKGNYLGVVHLHDILKEGIV